MVLTSTTFVLEEGKNCVKITDERVAAFAEVFPDKTSPVSGQIIGGEYTLLAVVRNNNTAPKIITV